MITDIKLCETSSGGDLRLNDAGDDIATIQDLSNQPYLAMFGGNKEANTEPDAETEFKENLDFWANNLLFPQDSDSQFNSDTERALDNNSLTSTGRTIIEQAVKSDVKLLEPDNVDVSIPALDTVEIDVLLADKFNFKWDCSGKETVIVPVSDFALIDNNVYLTDNGVILINTE